MQRGGRIYPAISFFIAGIKHHRSEAIGKNSRLRGNFRPKKKKKERKLTLELFGKNKVGGKRFRSIMK